MKNRSFAHRFRRIAVIAILGVSVVCGKRTTPTPPSSPSPGSSGGSTRLPGNTSTSPIPGQTNPNQNQLPYPGTQRPIFLSGKVVLSDGTPPPQSVVIERVCNGTVRPEGNTDSKGRFSFQLGQNAMAMMDASVSGPDSARGMGAGNLSNPSAGTSVPRDLFNCEIRASLPGFRSDVVSLATRRSLDNPDVGTIVLHRLGNVEGLTISATSLAAPKDAKKAYDKGHELLGKSKLDDAQKHLEKAVEEYPKYAIAWYDLGRVHERQNDPEGARKAYGEALAADSKFISPYEGLANIAARERKWQETADITDRMIRLNPVDFPNAYLLNAIAKLNLKQIDEAEKSATSLLAMDTGHRIPKAEHVMGVILAQKQDYSGAAQHIKKFIDLAGPGADVETAKQQLQELEKTLAADKQ
jgi:tetratricopeptide (TPR) repeat protein